MSLKNSVRDFFRREDGASMVEYAVALLVVSTIGISALSALGVEAGENVADACREMNSGADC